MKLKSFTVIAAAALTIASTMFAGENAPRTASFPNFRAMSPGAVPDAGAGIYLSDVTMGYSTTGVPCFGSNGNCGPVNSISIPYPVTHVKGGSAVDIITQLQDVSYTGVPTIAIAITKGSTTVYSGYVTFNSALGPNYVAYAYFPITLPTGLGEYTVEAEILSNSTSIGNTKMKFTIY